MTLSLTLSTPLLVCFLLLSKAFCSDGRLSVPTTSGIVTGHYAANGSGVMESLGIPYAKPPVGNLRFAPPERFTGNGTLDAIEFGFDCPSFSTPPPSYPGLLPDAQSIIASFASTIGDNNPQSEDCLTLNIWSKGDGTAKPVVVFFYGGRFALGTTNTEMLKGDLLAESTDLIVVTVNYRTNIFGFPGGPGDAPQNLGLRDQRSAVEWVFDNIEGFGGDPEKIILAGQSAGGVSVDYWTYAYKDHPIVKGTFAFSGNALSFPANSRESAQNNFQKVVDAVNCSSSVDTIACMRDIDWKEVLDAAMVLPPGFSNSPLRPQSAFYPTIDEEIVFSDYLIRSESGDFARIPAIFSNTHNEEGYYRIPALRRGSEPTLRETDSFLLESFTCPNSYQAQSRTKHGVPSWLIRYFGDFDNVRLYRDSGAYHGVDMHAIFGRSEQVSGQAQSEQQRQVSHLMQRALGAFAHDPSNGLSQELGWPRYGENEKSLVLVAVQNQPGVRFGRPGVYDSFCKNITMAGETMGH